jgi:hypothetical protein
MDITCGIFLVLAPMLFLAMWKHSLGTCCGCPVELDPKKYLAAQLDMLLHGFSITAPSPSQAMVS